MTGRSNLRSEIAMVWDGYDPWGSVLSALGGVCDVLYATGGDIPASTGYSPGPIRAEMSLSDVISDSDYPSSMFGEMFRDGEIGTVDLEYWARVLDRFADLVPEDERY